MAAAGQYLALMFVFDRKRMRADVVEALEKDPPGSWGVCNEWLDGHR